MIVQIKSVTPGTHGEYAFREINYITSEGKAGKKRVWEDLKDKWDLLKVGDTVELKLEKTIDGKYWNVIDILPSSLPKAIEKAETATYATHAQDNNVKMEIEKERNRSIIKQQALIQAIAYASLIESKKISTVLYVADIFDKWLTGEIKITDIKAFEQAYPSLNKDEKQGGK